MWSTNICMVPQELISPTVYGKKSFIYIMMVRKIILHLPESNARLFSVKIGQKSACVFQLNMNPKPCYTVLVFGHQIQVNMVLFCQLLMLHVPTQIHCHKHSPIFVQCLDMSNKTISIGLFKALQHIHSCYAAREMKQ